MDYFTVSIPVKTYVKKYIEARYPQPMILTLNNYLGNVVYSYLEKHKADHLLRTGDNWRHLRHQKLKDHIDVKIPKYLVNKYWVGLHISDIKGILINKLFEEKIAEDLHTYCKVYHLAGMSSRQAIEDFCTEHGIELEIDITYEAFKKAQQRHKKTLLKHPTNLSHPFLTR